MFGYIRPCRDTLRMRDYDRYRAAYCGLCHALGKRCGFAARFLVSYDMTFLYLLLQSPEPAGCIKKCRCPARIKRKACEVDSPVMDRAADLSVLLYYWKLRDEVSDSDSILRRTGCRIAAAALHSAYRKAAQAQPEADRMIRSQLQKLAELENAKSDMLDAPADAFAKILTAFASHHPQQRAVEQVLYHIGRYIYLTDALDDLAKDCETDSYNPLRYRFAVESGTLSAEDLVYFRSTVNSSVGMACAALELLTMQSGDELLRNILYEGMPLVLNLVAEGKFEAKGKI